MVKKTIISIIVIVLLAAVFVNASHHWTNPRYGAVYYSGQPYYSYYPYYIYPYDTSYPYSYYRFPTYYYPYYDMRYTYTKTAPTVSYPASPTYPLYVEARGSEGELCGTAGEKQFGCEYGLVCDYTKTGTTGLGVCAKQTYTTTYPYSVSPSVTYPYYYS